MKILDNRTGITTATRMVSVETSPAPVPYYGIPSDRAQREARQALRVELFGLDGHSVQLTWEEVEAAYNAAVEATRVET